MGKVIEVEINSSPIEKLGNKVSKVNEGFITLQQNISKLNFSPSKPSNFNPLSKPSFPNFPSLQKEEKLKPISFNRKSLDEYQQMLKETPIKLKKIANVYDKTGKLTEGLVNLQDKLNKQAIKEEKRRKKELEISIKAAAGTHKLEVALYRTSQAVKKMGASLKKFTQIGKIFSLISSGVIAGFTAIMNSLSRSMEKTREAQVNLRMSRGEAEALKMTESVYSSEGKLQDIISNVIRNTMDNEAGSTFAMLGLNQEDFKGKGGVEILNSLLPKMQQILSSYKDGDPFKNELLKAIDQLTGQSVYLRGILQNKDYKGELTESKMTTILGELNKNILKNKGLESTYKKQDLLSEEFNRSWVGLTSSLQRLVVASSPALRGIFDSLAFVFDKALNPAIESTMNSISNFIKEAGQKGIFSTIQDRLVSMFKAVGNSLWDWIMEKIKSLKESIRSIFSPFSSSSSSSSKPLKSPPKNLTGGGQRNKESSSNTHKAQIDINIRGADKVQTITSSISKGVILNTLTKGK